MVGLHAIYGITRQTPDSVTLIDNLQDNDNSVISHIVEDGDDFDDCIHSYQQMVCKLRTIQLDVLKNCINSIVDRNNAFYFSVNH